MRCPRCGSDKVNLTETTKTTQTSGYSCGKGCCGMLLFANPLGALCGVAGKNKVDTEHISYWICNECGARFQRGMSDEMYNFKVAYDKVPDKLKFIPLDDSSDQLHKIKIALNHLKAFPDLWEGISIDEKLSMPQITKTVAVIMFKENIPDMICCLASKKNDTLKMIKNTVNSIGNDAITVGECLTQDQEFGWDFDLYTGFIMSSQGFHYYDGKNVHFWKYGDIKEIRVADSDITIYHPTSGIEISLKPFLSAEKIKGDKLRAFVRFLQGALTDNLAFAGLTAEDLENGKNNTSICVHNKKLYAFIESQALLENNSKLAEVDSKGQYHMFSLVKGETIFYMNSDENYLYFCSQNRLSRIKWSDIDAHQEYFEDIMSEVKEIKYFSIINTTMYYIQNKHLKKIDLNSKQIKDVVPDMECSGPMIRDGEVIYFINLSDQRKLYRMRLDDEITEKVMDEIPKSYTICKQKIIYRETNLNADLVLADMNTGEKQFVDNMVENINAAGDHLFYKKKNQIVQYNVLMGDKKIFSFPPETVLVSGLQVAGNIIGCKMRGSSVVNYIINIQDGIGQEL